MSWKDDREFLGVGDNMEDAASQYNVGDYEMEPTGECFNNDTLRSFEVRDFDGKLIYFVELNFEDMVYVRARYNDYGKALFDPFKIVVRKFVVIHGHDRERTYKREHGATLADAAVMFHNLVADFAADRWNVFA